MTTTTPTSSGAGTVALGGVGPELTASAVPGAQSPTPSAAPCAPRAEPVALEVPTIRVGTTRSGRRTGAGAAGLGVAGRPDDAELLDQMRTGELGSLHSWELVTAVDGPGTRLTVFVSGCPLRCLYCHNPDTRDIGNGQLVSAAEVLERVRRYLPVFAATGGGLTISGGEPLAQPAFVARLLAGAKEMGVHTTLDTSGYLGRLCTDEMLENVDLVLLDVKSGVPGTYRRVTGAELQPTLDFGRRLSERGVETWIRYVLVPGLTDEVENVDAVARYVGTLAAVSRVEVLPFHQMGQDKWEALGLRYELAETRPPALELVERVREQFRARGKVTY